MLILRIQRNVLALGVRGREMITHERNRDFLERFYRCQTTGTEIEMVGDTIDVLFR